MKLSTLAFFGAGYVLGTRAGRQRYDQLRVLAGRLADEFDGSDAQQRLLQVSNRLEAYARENRLNGTMEGKRAQPKA